MPRATERLANVNLQVVAAKAKAMMDQVVGPNWATDPEMMASYHAAVAGVLTAAMLLDDAVRVNARSLRYFGMAVPDAVHDETPVVAIDCDESGQRVKILITFGKYEPSN